MAMSRLTPALTGVHLFNLENDGLSQPQEKVFPASETFSVVFRLQVSDPSGWALSCAKWCTNCPWVPLVSRDADSRGGQWYWCDLRHWTPWCESISASENGTVCWACSGSTLKHMQKHSQFAQPVFAGGRVTHLIGLCPILGDTEQQLSTSSTSHCILLLLGMWLEWLGRDVDPICSLE